MEILKEQRLAVAVQVAQNVSTAVTIQGIPSHGNEVADALANEATTSEDWSQPVSVEAVRACVKETITDCAHFHPESPQHTANFHGRTEKS